MLGPGMDLVPKNYTHYIPKNYMRGNQALWQKGTGEWKEDSPSIRTCFAMRVAAAVRSIRSFVRQPVCPVLGEGGGFVKEEEREKEEEVPQCSEITVCTTC